jgi:hypothetical protein
MKERKHYITQRSTENRVPSSKRKLEKSRYKEHPQKKRKKKKRHQRKKELSKHPKKVKWLGNEDLKIEEEG